MGILEGKILTLQAELKALVSSHLTVQEYLWFWHTALCVLNTEACVLAVGLYFTTLLLLFAICSTQWYKVFSSITKLQFIGEFKFWKTLLNCISMHNKCIYTSLHSHFRRNTIAGYLEVKKMKRHVIWDESFFWINVPVELVYGLHGMIHL